MHPINDCETVTTDQAIFYLGPSTEEYSEGYLELAPHTSLPIHNRTGSIETVTQFKNKCVMVIFDESAGTNHLLDENDKLEIVPEGVWHIHANPFSVKSITHWRFKGDIRKVIKNIRNHAE
jgi:hypothetical protein